MYKHRGLIKSTANKKKFKCIVNITRKHPQKVTEIKEQYYVTFEHVRQGCTISEKHFITIFPSIDVNDQIQGQNWG